MKSMIQMVAVLSLLCGLAGFSLSYLKMSTATQIESQVLTFVQGPAILEVFKGAENSPIEDRNHVRLNMARAKLQSGEYNVFEAAQAVGFSNLSFFIRLYKKKFGHTPGHE